MIDNTLKVFREKVCAEIMDQERRSRARVGRWNWIFYGALIGSILFSTAAVLVPQIERSFLGLKWQDLTSIAAGIAGAMTAAISVFGIERRWRASRNRLAGTHQLRNDVLDPAFDPKSVKDKLNTIIERYARESGGAFDLSKQ